MTTYLLIGLIVQMIIIVLRTMRGVADWTDFNWAVAIGVVVCSIINILLWPITIISEIVNTILGI